jgi:hypothetical protein
LNGLEQNKTKQNKPKPNQTKTKQNKPKPKQNKKTGSGGDPFFL